MTEGVEFRRIAALERQVERLEAEKKQLREALATYTTATTVANWGMQELADVGELARRTLGLPEPTPHDLAQTLGTVCRCVDCETKRELWNVSVEGR